MITGITYGEVTSVTQNPIILIVIGGIWLFTLALYLIIAGNVHPRTSSGAKLKGSLLSKPIGWIAVFLWIVQGVLTYLLLINPIWMGKL